MSKTEGSENATKKIERPGVSLIVASKKVNESSVEEDMEQFSTESGPAIKMPSLSKVLDLNGSAPKSVSTKFFVSSFNPFQSSSSEKQARGTIVSMELTDENGQALSVNNTQAPFVIRVPSPQPAPAYQSNVGLIGFTYYKVIINFYHLFPKKF